MNTSTHPARLSNDNLLAEVKRAAATERRATVQLIALLGEVEARRLYLREGSSSMHTYCTQVLHLSDDAAFFRIETARAVRSYPVIFEMLTDGALSPTVVRLLRPHLTHENYRELLEAARYKSKRQVEALIARLRPQPAVPSSVRKLPAPQPIAAMAAPTSDPVTPALLTGVGTDIAEPQVASDVNKLPEPVIHHVSAGKPPVVKPLAPERYKVQFTMSAVTHAKLRQVQDLLRHQVPNGDPAEIFDRGLTLLLEHLQRTKLAAAKRPRRQEPANARSRHIPAAVKREVWKRDGGRCAFVGTEGRCTETGCLEFHHVEPYAVGGVATRQNIELRCRAHNAYEAELFFGTVKPVMVRECPAIYASGSTRSGTSSPSPARRLLSRVTAVAIPRTFGRVTGSNQRALIPRYDESP